MSNVPTPVAFQVLQAPDTSMDTLLGATERLQQSRQKMRHQMMALNANSAQAQATRTASGHSNALIATLAALPLIGPVIESAASWWENHPLQAVAGLFMKSSTPATDPQQQTLTQRHPWAMLLGAVGIGALLMWTRPWRFGLLRRAIYAGIAPQMVSSLLSRVSSDGLLDLFSSVLGRSSQDAAPLPPHHQRAEHDGTAPSSALH